MQTKEHPIKITAQFTHLCLLVNIGPFQILIFLRTENRQINCTTSSLLGSFSSRNNYECLQGLKNKQKFSQWTSLLPSCWTSELLLESLPSLGFSDFPPTSFGHFFSVFCGLASALTPHIQPASEHPNRMLITPNRNLHLRRKLQTHTSSFQPDITSGYVSGITN